MRLHKQLFLLSNKPVAKENVYLMCNDVGFVIQGHFPPIIQSQKVLCGSVFN